MTRRYPCTCRGYDPADPAMHGDTSEGCPRHDQSITGDDARAEHDEREGTDADQ